MPASNNQRVESVGSSSSRVISSTCVLIGISAGHGTHFPRDAQPVFAFSRRRCYFDRPWTVYSTLIFFKELEWRGFLHSATPGVKEHLAAGQVTGYIGFDPTASSLHVGSLLPIMGLVHLQRCGHRPIAIAGGGTGMIGDPSGKSQERNLLGADEIGQNLEGIRAQLSHFLDFGKGANPALIVNNADWLAPLRVMDFLRDVGKFFSVNEMLARDSVKSRIAKEQGISYTEFSYSVLQSYDFLALFDRFGCTLQMGGSDQWGNIVSGIDLIRRMRSRDVHGIVYPLITTSSGAKFGKTEAGTVWLDPVRTSPYGFYQFWLNTDDKDVVQYLKFFTLLPPEEIRGLAESHGKDPGKREAHRNLASAVTAMLHGESGLAQANRASEIFFGAEIAGVPEQVLLEIFSDVPSCEYPRSTLESGAVSIVDLLVAAGVAGSKGEARRAVEGGGIYLNNVTDRIPRRDRRAGGGAPRKISRPPEREQELHPRPPGLTRERCEPRTALPGEFSPASHRLPILSILVIPTQRLISHLRTVTVNPSISRGMHISGLA